NWRRLRPGELGEPRGSQFAGVRCFRSRYRFGVGREPNLLRSGSTPTERHSIRRHVQRVESLPHPGNRQLGNVCYRRRCQDRCTTTHDVLCRRWPSPCDGSPSWPESDSPRVTQHDTWHAAGSRGDHLHRRSPAPAGCPRRSVYRRNYRSFQFQGRDAGHRRCPGNRRPYIVSTSRPNETGDSRRCGCVARGAADRRRFSHVGARSLKQMNSTLGECMAPRRTAVLVSVALLFAGIETSVGNAQESPAPVKAVQLLGLTGVKQNAKGTLKVENGNLQFVHGKTNADITAASIQDIVTGDDTQRSVGGAVGVMSMAAPYGGGRFLSLFRKKIDTLTIQYRDV